MLSLTEISISPDNYLWSNCNSMARRNININCIYTTQQVCAIKSVLKETLSTNLDKKCIIYTNMASSVSEMQNSLESWLELSEEIRVRKIERIYNPLIDIRDWSTLTVFFSSIHIT